MTRQEKFAVAALLGPFVAVVLVAALEQLVLIAVEELARALCRGRA